MTREERELLRQDLCARVPYGIIVKVIKYGKCYDEREKNKTVDCKIVGINRYTLITDKDNLKHTYSKGYVSTPITVPIDDGDMKSLPYLRPLSSITSEEDNELNKMLNEAILNAVESGETGFTHKNIAHNRIAIDFFNKKMLDYRGLIPMSLALEAPEGMYKFN